MTTRRIWLRHALWLAVLLPGAAAQNPPSTSSPSPPTASGPIPGAPAAQGAPTVLIRESETAYRVNLTSQAPVHILQLEHSVSSLSIVFNLYSEGQPDDVGVYASTRDGGHTFHPGHTTVEDPSSGGTKHGGYNARGDGTWRVQWDHGFANWTYGYTLEHGPDAEHPVTARILVGRGIDDGLLYNPDLVNDGNVTLFVTVRENFGDHEALVSQLTHFHPLVGDSTATEALVFSPLLYRDPIPQPTYPNYTLPGSELSLPEWDVVRESVGRNSSTAHTNFPFGRGQLSRLFVIETEKSPVPLGLAHSYAAVTAMEAAAKNDTNSPPGPVLGNSTQWVALGGVEGFRTWVIATGLKPNTNYTVWAASESGPIMTPPAWFVTKGDDFPCALAPPTDLCPGVAHAVPFPKADGSVLAAIPEAVNQSISDNLEAFASSLGAAGLACGRDMYSFVATCLDCYTAYRQWLCHIVLPQCAAADPPAFQSVFGKNAPTKPLTVQRTPDDPRNPNSSITFPYTELQPCIGLCTAVERKCPNSLGWTCPHRNFNAKESYAYITKDNKKNDGNARTGWPAQDIWGNRWCSM